MNIHRKGNPASGSKSNLSKREILRGYQAFSQVVSEGRRTAGIYLRAYVLEVEPSANQGVPLRVGFAVNRRVRKAVVRNRIRRLMREAYRKHIARWMAERREKRFWQLVLVYKGMDTTGEKRPTYTDIERDTEEILRRLFSSR